MVDAGAIRAGDRLPWLEPYRPPSRQPSNRRPGLAAMISVAVLSGLAAFLATRVAPTPEAEAPATQIVLSARSAMQPPTAAPAPSDKPPSVRSEVATSSPTSAPAGRTSREVNLPIMAELSRESNGAVMHGQVEVGGAPSEISPESLAIAALTVLPGDPPRPAVNPSAQVVRGKTVQLGVFKSALQAEIAWRSAIRDYTYLVTMPKSIEPIRIRSKLYYRLQLGTPSGTHARQLCGNLKQIGRACKVA